MTDQSAFRLNRRRFIAGSGGGLLIAALPGIARADEAALLQARLGLFGKRSIQDGRVTVKLPPIAENGNSVPLSVKVDSPMTANDHVTRIAVLSPRNPLPDVAQFHLGPRAGKAEVATRIRLSGTQSIQAIAEMSDGSLWSGSMETVVTLAACVIL